MTLVQITTPDRGPIYVRREHVVAISRDSEKSRYRQLLLEGGFVLVIDDTADNMQKLLEWESD